MTSLVRSKNTLFTPESLLWAPFESPFRGFKGFPLDVREEKTAYVVEAEIPGADRENISVDFKDGVLSIEYQHQESGEKQSEGYVFKERTSSYGSRRLSFGDDIDEDAITATYQDGVLAVNLPKKEIVEKKKIAIEIK